MTCMTALLVSCQSTPDMDVEQQVDALYQKMPQEERIAQLKSMYMEELFNAECGARHGGCCSAMADGEDSQRHSCLVP